MQFADGWNVKMEDKGEVMDETSMVEMSGYIPPDEQIRAIIQAGERLDAHRMEEYDAEAAEPDINPAASKSFDFADAHALVQDLEAKARESFTQYEKDQQAAAAKAHQEEIDAAVAARLEEFKKSPPPENNV